MIPIFSQMLNLASMDKWLSKLINFDDFFSQIQSLDNMKVEDILNLDPIAISKLKTWAEIKTILKEKHFTE